MTKQIPVVILCGGQGTRLREETETRPKPMVEIGGKPILWHIMSLYAHFGFDEFILCLGYKGQVIKEYFLNYDLMTNDFTVVLGKKPKTIIHDRKPHRAWKVTLVDTGDVAMTGARLKRVERYVDGRDFMLSYGDGVGNVDIADLMKFHRRHGRIGTVTGVRPPSRFGEIVFEKGRVVEFNEKPQISEGYINGGFFVFSNRFFSYLPSGDDLVLEKKPLEDLAKRRELMVYPHGGFWQCMDTYRDYKLLNELWDSGKKPWTVSR